MVQQLKSILIGLVCGISGLAWSQSCSSSSAQRPMVVVELYTSQGCSSCPPADRWLSLLQARDDVLAMAFHVNYWNHLGWKDPFATAQITERQVRLKAVLGGDYVYTPQVTINGVEERAWARRQSLDLQPLKVRGAPTVVLQRQGETVTAQVSAQVGASAAGAPLRWAGYWVVLQDAQNTRVVAGENAGRQLRNDHVVVHYEPVPAWSSAQVQSFKLNAALAPGQRAAFVVTQDHGIVPVQAVLLACANQG
jgi:hypothetical protein